MILNIIKHLNKIIDEDPIPEETLIEWANQFEEEGYDVEKMKIVVRTFFDRRIRWNPFRGVNNIINTYNSIYTLPCLDTHYVKTPLNTFVYKDHEYQKKDWNGLVNRKWLEYRERSNNCIESHFDEALYDFRRSLERISLKPQEWRDKEKQELFNNSVEKYIGVKKQWKEK